MGSGLFCFLTSDFSHLTSPARHFDEGLWERGGISAAESFCDLFTCFSKKLSKCFMFFKGASAFWFLGSLGASSNKGGATLASTPTLPALLFAHLSPSER